ncbi:MAG: hypothetical protein J0H92_14750 [Sphingobacteriales bacterium]|nr:hypothetical protein [Sphingobacteriales bacterium]OJW31668.1 MAG: hypothetical protein BGO54_14555 [Sphingobacteriales bacterium 46-32]
MTPTRDEQYATLIAPLYFYFKLSDRAYKKYMANKILLHALNIYEANTRIKELLINHPTHIPHELLDDAIELINHYSIWMNQFEEFRGRQSFELKDYFIFYHIDDQSAFPRQSEQHFIDYYNKQNKIPENG